MRSTLRIATLISCALALTACTTSHTQTGATLAPGESATLRLLGPRAGFALHNTGNQPLEYTVAEEGATSAGTIGPGGHDAETRSGGDLTLTITNPGPNPAQATIESRSRGGMEFNQPGRGGS